MAELITMPKLGFNMDEGKLVKWYKKEGERVEKGEPLFSVETDKTSIDIEATVSGVVRRLFIEEGDTLPVFFPLAVVAEADENIDEMVEKARVQLQAEDPAATGKEGKMVRAAREPEPGPESRQEEAGVAGELRISPRARRVAANRGIPLGKLSSAVGTGFQGGICEKDVLLYAEQATGTRATPLARRIAEAEGIGLEKLAGSGVGGKILREDVLEALVTESEAGLDPEHKEILETIPYNGVRKIIGERLSASAQTSPHIYFTHQVNMEKLLGVREEVDRLREQKASVTDYIAQAVVLALKKYPDVNASLVGEVIEIYKTINLGIAVAAPTGLIVPVIKNAEKMGLMELSAAARVLTVKAREGKLVPDEYSGGTFTISNLGMFGIENFTAIINPPEAAILAISATTNRAVVLTKDNGKKEIAIKPLMQITLSVDHRLIDGLLAARFLGKIKHLLENPIGLLV